MTDRQSNAILTPCKNICVIDIETSECIGCGRTRHEIAGWMRMSDAERQDIVALLDERVASLTKRKKRKGGARARARRQAPSINILNFPSTEEKGS